MYIQILHKKEHESARKVALFYIQIFGALVIIKMLEYYLAIEQLATNIFLHSPFQKLIFYRILVMHLK